MGLSFQGNDDVALARLCAEFDLDAPSARNTRDNIEAVAAAAEITLTGNGNDRNLIDELYDALVAAAVPVYALDAGLAEIQALFATALACTMSNGSMTGTVTLDAELAESTDYKAFPAGMVAQTATRLDAGASAVGNLMAGLTLPAATNGSAAPAYSVMVNIANANTLAPIGRVSVTRTDAGALEFEAVRGGSSNTGALGSTPADMGFEFNGPAGTMSVLVGGVAVLEDIAYTPGDITMLLTIAQAAGLATGDGSNVIAAISHTLNVVEPA